MGFSQANLERLVFISAFDSFHPRSLLQVDVLEPRIIIHRFRDCRGLFFEKNEIGKVCFP